MGYFQTAYDLYLPFYSVAISGLPVLLSRLVARSVSLNDGNGVKSAFFSCRILFTVFGVIIAAAVVLCSLFLTFFGGADDAKTADCMLLLHACFFPRLWEFTADIFKGINNMAPAAVSQVIEALGKAVAGVAAAAVLKICGFSVGIQAAGAAGNHVATNLIFIPLF